MSPKKKPVKKTKAISKPPAVEATNYPPIPHFYLNDVPPESDRANIKIDIHEKGTAEVSVPAKRLNSVTGLVVGVCAVAAPVAALGIACNAQLAVPAIIAVTAMATGISLLALLLIFYMVHQDRQARSK